MKIGKTRNEKMQSQTEAIKKENEEIVEREKE